MSKGLLTLQTDLKSLRYGSDKPYVTKDINKPPSSNQIGMQVTKRVDDLSRVAQMLVDRPGLKHLGNEALLHQTNVAKKIKNRGKKTILQAVLGQVGSTLLAPIKVIGSTLAQVPVNGTGTHFVRGFRTDTYLQPTNSDTFSAFASFFGAGGVEGAPYALRGEVVPGRVKDSNFYTGENVVTSSLKSLDLSKTTNKYLPSVSPSEAATRRVLDTVLGTGASTVQGTYLEQEKAIVTVVETTATSGSILGSIPNLTTGSYGPNTLGIVQQTTSKYTGLESGSYITSKVNYKSLNKNITKEARIRLGDQGARKDEDKRANNYWTTGSDAIDGINALAPQTAKKAGDSGKVNGETVGRDLIKFRFHIITPDQPETVLYFRAFLDSFADNYSGQWNPVKYLGRAEDFQIYGGFQRKISLSFKIAASTRSEMLPIYQKMVWLASATAPTYADGGQFMRGTLTKITVGDYVYELPGVLNSVNYTWNTDYPWEIAMTEPEGKGKDDFEQELPMVMDCSIDFTPIHQFTPTTGLRKYITTDLTENNKTGIPGINTENTGTGITATATTVDTNRPYTTSGAPFTQDFGPQNA